MKIYFIGWYYKHSNQEESLAVIPCKTAHHAFIWVICKQGSYHIRYPLSQFSQRGKTICIGSSTFSPSGIQLKINTPKLTLTGTLRYTHITPLKGHIMGPFNLLPMECKHHIISMHHCIQGSVILNGKTIDFTGGNGYIESDKGTSFPSKYAWTQCNSFGAGKHAGITVAAATIPMFWGNFNGCIAAIHLNGKQITLATYKGAKIKKLTRRAMVITQGKYSLYVRIRPKWGKKLPAPKNGAMKRYIKENLQTQGEFILLKGDTCIFYGKSKFTSWEYEW